MLLYRVESQELDGKSHVWLFGENDKQADKKIKSLKNEKVLKTVWAELSTCLGGEDEPDNGWEVEYGFERETTWLFGRKMFTGKEFWF